MHLLVIHFLEHYKQRTGRFVSGISKDALRALISYGWPGNVRELENAIERAVIIAAGRQIELEDLPAAIANVAAQRQATLRAERAHAASEGRSAMLELDLPSSMDEIERPRSRPRGFTWAKKRAEKSEIGADNLSKVIRQWQEERIVREEYDVR